MNVMTLHSDADAQAGAKAASARDSAEPALAPSGASKWFAVGLSAVMLVAVMLPVRENWQTNPKDDFPLSYFPMFSEARGETYKVTHLVGLDAEANRTMIRHNFAGTGGLNQVRRQIRKTAREGGSAGLCQSVAARVAKSKQSALAAVSQIQVVTGEYRLNEYFAGNRNPVAEVVHATCEVERSRQ
jgi:hypothetical protein